MLVAVLTGPALSDGFTPLQQTRHISGEAFAVPCGEQPVQDSAVAGDFGPFDESILAEQVCDALGAVAEAAQVSSISQTVLAASASTSALTHFVGAGGVQSVAGSFYEVQVELGSPARIRIQGDLSAEAEAEKIASIWVIAEVTLAEGAGVLFQQQLMAVLNDPPVDANVDHIRRLDPGVYVFRVRADAIITDAFPTTGFFAASHDVTLQAFHPADVDLDGLVDIIDLLQVLGQWGPCPRECPGDVDGDGEVGILDFLAVLSAWGADGP